MTYLLTIFSMNLLLAGQSLNQIGLANRGERFKLIIQVTRLVPCNESKFSNIFFFEINYIPPIKETSRHPTAKLNIMMDGSTF